MSEDEKRRLTELEEKTAYILARQDAHEARMNNLTARLVYAESCLHRLMSELGILPESLDSIQAALTDARTINLNNDLGNRLN